MIIDLGKISLVLDESNEVPLRLEQPLMDAITYLGAYIRVEKTRENGTVHFHLTLPEDAVRRLSGEQDGGKKNLLSDESIPTLRDMLATAEREAGIDSQSARTIRRALRIKLTNYTK